MTQIITKHIICFAKQIVIDKVKINCMHIFNFKFNFKKILISLGDKIKYRGIIDQNLFNNKSIYKFMGNILTLPY